MKALFFLIFVFVTDLSTGQIKHSVKLTVNGASAAENGCIVFPLTGYTMPVDKSGAVEIDIYYPQRRVFYYSIGNAISRILRVNKNMQDTLIDLKIPDPDFYNTFYKSNTCPLCLKSDSVVAIVYGKPHKQTIEEADKGKLKLGGCMPTDKHLFCKRDNFEY